METKSNITPNILSKIGKNLHNKKNHPIEIVKQIIYKHLGSDFEKFDDLNPKVTIEDNFDLLLIPKDSPVRKHSDTYYFDEKHVLRTHTSAHQNELLSVGYNKFLVSGQVFRKDDVDKFHHCSFHQMEGVCVIEESQDAEIELKATLSGIIDVLFPGCNYRFKEDYFPFTNPSWEVEVMFNGQWLEILGCGIIQPEIMKNCGLESKTAFAFGIGIERLCLILFKIPDIRYLWSEDPRFIEQFASGEIIEFKEYSNFPPITRDIAFWISDKFHHNDFCEIVREIGGDLIENVSLIDEFTNKTGKTSKCYRIVYRSNERTLTNEEINDIHEKIKNLSVEKLEIEIR
jgi:phenylalanyl-tRNA synthetase alpha chain